MLMFSLFVVFQIFCDSYACIGFCKKKISVFVCFLKFNEVWVFFSLFVLRKDDVYQLILVDVQMRKL